MNFDQPNEPKFEPETKEENMETQEKLQLFKSTADFKNQAEKRPEEAEEWMNAAFAEDERYQGNEKWLMDQQRTLLGIYCEQENKEGAIRVIEQTRDPFAQEGRIKKFEKVFGETYTGEKQKPQFENNPDSDIEITDSASFKKAISQEGRRGIKKAEEWLEKMANQEKYSPNVLIDREKELEQAKQYWQEKWSFSKTPQPLKKRRDKTLLLIFFNFCVILNKVKEIN